MPSTRKQRDKEKRSRQSEVISDMESLNIMLGRCSRNEAARQLSDNEANVDLMSNGPQNNVNPTSEHFRTLLNIITERVVKSPQKQ